MAFMKHAGIRYSDVISRLKSKGEKPRSVSEEVWAEWKAFWNSNSEMNKSKIARSNRMSEPAGPGTGPVHHTGGTRSAIKHREVMVCILILFCLYNDTYFILFWQIIISIVFC